MAKQSTILTQNAMASVPGQIRQLFIDAAWEGFASIGALVSGTNCEYFVIAHVSGAELLFQIPTSTASRSNPTHFAAAYTSNHAFMCLASADSVSSMWTRLYTDSLLPNNASFWADITSTPCLLFSELYSGQGNIDFDVHLRDDADDFDMLWVVRNEGALVGIKGAAILSTRLASGVAGMVSWHGNSSTGFPEGCIDVAIDPLNGARLGAGADYSTAFSSFRDARSQVRTQTASMDTNSATYDMTQTVPLYAGGKILGTMDTDLIRFCRTTVVRNESWTDPVDGRNFTSCGDGLMIGNLTADPIYVGA